MSLVAIFFTQCQKSKTERIDAISRKSSFHCATIATSVANEINLVQIFFFLQFVTVQHVFLDHLQIRHALWRGNQQFLTNFWEKMFCLHRKEKSYHYQNASHPVLQNKTTREMSLFRTNYRRYLPFYSMKGIMLFGCLTLFFTFNFITHHTDNGTVSRQRRVNV